MIWRCEAHGVVTAGDCPRCDDELIAFTEDEQRSEVTATGLRTMLARIEEPGE